MKLLIVTQVVDTTHPVLGFFHRWIEEFARHCEQVQVICLQEGVHDLPSNVTVHSLGKEYGGGRLVYLWRFYKYIWKLRHEYDSVFVHMNQIYVLLGGWWWRLLGKNISLWYVHRQVTPSLRAATLLTHQVFTSTPESLQIKTKKVSYVGHGIDITRFASVHHQRNESVLQIAHVGRITEIKNLDCLIEAARLLADVSCTFHLYGPAQTRAEQQYKTYLEKLLQQYGLESSFVFHGSVSNEQIPAVLATMDLTVNLAPTGGMDKAVIESAAAGVPVLVSNEAFASSFGTDWYNLHVQYQDPQDLADKIRQIRGLTEEAYESMQHRLRTQAKAFSVDSLVQKVLTQMFHE